MSTLINDLKQGELQTNGVDDSQMIDEILQEMDQHSGDGSALLGNTPIQPSIPQPTQMGGGVQAFQHHNPFPNTHLSRQLDPSVNMAATDMMGGGYGSQQGYTEKPIAAQPVKSWKDTIIEKVKNPLIVALLVLVIFSPIITGLLTRYVPRLYNPSVSVIHVWIGLVLKAVVTAVLFFVINMFV